MMSYRHNRRSKARAAAVDVVKVPASFTVTAEQLEPVTDVLAQIQADMLAAMRESLARDVPGYGSSETPEERAARYARQERRQREWEALRAAQRAEAHAHRDRVRALAGGNPITIAVLALHTPDTESGRPVCLGCDIDGYDAEYPEWPCSTWQLIEEMVTR